MRPLPGPGQAILSAIRGAKPRSGESYAKGASGGAGLRGARLAALRRLPGTGHLTIATGRPNNTDSRLLARFS